MGKELVSEIVTQIDNLVFEDKKRQNQYEVVRFAKKVELQKMEKQNLKEGTIKIKKQS